MIGIELRDARDGRLAAEQVALLSRLSADCGLDGVVCSAQEASMLRLRHNADFKLVTPGIRLEGDAAGDQRRILTPGRAMASGADYLVIGRSITGADDPAMALERALSELDAK